MQRQPKQTPKGQYSKSTRPRDQDFAKQNFKDFDDEDDFFDLDDADTGFGKKQNHKKDLNHSLRENNDYKVNQSVVSHSAILNESVSVHLVTIYLVNSINHS